MNKHLLKFVLAAGLLSAAMLGLSRAEEVSAKEYGFRVTPINTYVDYEPGETYSGEMTIINIGEEETNFQMVAKPFSNDNSISEEWAATHTQIADWVTFEPENGTIASNEQIKIKYNITVPKDVPAGGQYASLNVEGVNQANKNLPATVSVGMTVYANIDNGNTKEEAKLLDHNINGFIFGPPISASSTIENTGNTHIKATYILRVYPFFGGESLYNTEDNPEERTILPGSKRYFTVSWDSAPSIGIYKVVSEVRYLDQVKTIEKLVIICPVWVLILIGIFILALIFWIVSRVKARKAEA